MYKKNPKVDDFINNEKRWKGEVEKLRLILSNSSMSEEYKWGKPCYTYNGNNIVLIHAFKEYVALLFIKGSLMKDSEKILIKQTENVQAGRQLRFTTIQQIIEDENLIKEYIQEAIEVEKSGLKVEFKKGEDFTIVEEFQRELNSNSALKSAFEALTPGRQKGYLLYFSQGKQAKTRLSRIEKCIPLILDGFGLHDRS
jgi:uncharacterized protein YdeI (YjbR/CyaY-like superfamily)